MNVNDNPKITYSNIPDSIYASSVKTALNMIDGKNLPLCDILHEVMPPFTKKHGIKIHRGILGAIDCYESNPDVTEMDNWIQFFMLKCKSIWFPEHVGSLEDLYGMKNIWHKDYSYDSVFERISTSTELETKFDHTDKYIVFNNGQLFNNYILKEYAKTITEQELFYTLGGNMDLEVVRTLVLRNPTTFPDSKTLTHVLYAAAHYGNVDIVDWIFNNVEKSLLPEDLTFKTFIKDYFQSLNREDVRLNIIRNESIFRASYYGSNFAKHFPCIARLVLHKLGHFVSDQGFPEDFNEMVQIFTERNYVAWFETYERTYLQRQPISERLLCMMYELYVEYQKLLDRKYTGIDFLEALWNRFLKHNGTLPEIINCDSLEEYKSYSSQSLYALIISVYGSMPKHFIFNYIKYAMKIDYGLMYNLFNDFGVKTLNHDNLLGYWYRKRFDDPDENFIKRVNATFKDQSDSINIFGISVGNHIELYRKDPRTQPHETKGLPFGFDRTRRDTGRMPFREEFIEAFTADFQDDDEVVDPKYDPKISEEKPTIIDDDEDFEI